MNKHSVVIEQNTSPNTPVGADVDTGQTGGQLLVRSLTAQQVERVFCVPGGKIMPTLDVFRDEGPELIVCRHEQNAAFMAAAVGRMTGKPGVCFVTSGPGISNLVTGAATATTEGDPFVAIGGAVPLSQALKQVHQSMDAVAIMRPVTKFSVQIDHPAATFEAVANAFRAAVTPRSGAAFVALPADIQKAVVQVPSPVRVQPPCYGAARTELIEEAGDLIAGARCPVLLLGMGASQPTATEAVRELLRCFSLPVVGTFQGAGAVSRDLLKNFFGRIGLYRNQPGDRLLAHADVVITVGYDPVEYGPEDWNRAQRSQIIHVDTYPSEVDNFYKPSLELQGDIALTLQYLTKVLKDCPPRGVPSELQALHAEWQSLQNPPIPKRPNLVHPLSVVLTLRSLVDDDTVIANDIGSHHIWMARHFFAFEPRKLLFTNGQQTLGVGIPWAMAAALTYPGTKPVAIVGDGGFLYSSMELETAVRLKLNMTVVVFRDGAYNMVSMQQLMAYGRDSGTSFGNPDLVKYAESMGCVGLRVQTPDELEGCLRKALTIPGVTIVDIPVDYSENASIGAHILPDAWN